MYLKLESGSLMKDAWEGEYTECYNIKVKNSEKTGEEIEQMEQIRNFALQRREKTKRRQKEQLEWKSRLKGGM